MQRRRRGSKPPKQCAAVCVSNGNDELRCYHTTVALSRKLRAVVPLASDLGCSLAALSHLQRQRDAPT